MIIKVSVGSCQNIKKHDVERAVTYIELIWVCCLFLGYTYHSSVLCVGCLRMCCSMILLSACSLSRTCFWIILGPKPRETFYVQESGSKPGLVQQFRLKHGKWYPCTSFNPDFLKSCFGGRISVCMGGLVDIYIYLYLCTYTVLFFFWFRYVVLSAICFLPTESGEVIKFTSRETRVHKNPPIFASIPHDDHQFARSLIFSRKSHGRGFHHFLGAELWHSCVI